MTQQTNSTAIRIERPTAGATSTVRIDADKMKLALGFEPDPNAVGKNGQNLEFSFDDGGKIVLEGYYDHFTSKTLPVMVTEAGDELAGEDFLASLREDLLTAAGPGAGAGAAGSGAGEYADDAGNLVDGVDRLGSLGTDQWGSDSDIPDQFVGLGVTGIAGVTVAAADIPPGPVPEPEPEPIPEQWILHAHDNQDVVKVTEYHKEVPDGTITVPSEYTEETQTLDRNQYGAITGKLEEHNPDEYKDIFGLKSSSGDVGELTKWFKGTDGGDVLLNKMLGGLIDWDPNGSSVAAGVSSTITIPVEGAADSHSLTVSWAMYSVNGKPTLDNSFAVLFQVNPDKSLTAIATSDLKTHTESGKQPCTFTWDRLDPGAEYVVAYVVIEAGGDNGQKTILGFVDDVVHEYYTPETVETVYKDEYTYSLVVDGNVITDTGPDQDSDCGREDHYNKPGSESDFWVTRFTINGDEYEIDKGGSNQYTWKLSNGLEVTFTMSSDGEYKITSTGNEGRAPSPDELEITYTITCDDPNTADSSASLTLTLGPPESVDLPVMPSAGELHYLYGTGDDMHYIYGTDGDDIITVEAGNNILIGGAGSDTFVWTAEHMPGEHEISRDVIVDLHWDDAEHDVIDLSGIANLTGNDLKGAFVGDDLQISFDVPDGGTQYIVLENWASHAAVNQSAEDLLAAMILQEQIKLA